MHKMSFFSFQRRELFSTAFGYEISPLALTAKRFTRRLPVCDVPKRA